MVINMNSIMQENKNIFINLSNHPSNKWNEEQVYAALEYADAVDIIDIKHPDIDPASDEDQMLDLCNEYISKIQAYAKEDKLVYVHVMGESGFVFGIVEQCLTFNNIVPIHSTTNRYVEELSNGEKKQMFKFCKFRRY